jgi:putative PIN family toxin of toxin-antitoxin system
MRIVLDTNVLISSLITLGAPRELLRRILRREATLVISREILNEFMRVMRRKKFAEYATEEQVQ